MNKKLYAWNVIVDPSNKCIVSGVVRADNHDTALKIICDKYAYLNADTYEVCAIPINDNDVCVEIFNNL